MDRIQKMDEVAQELFYEAHHHVQMLKRCYFGVKVLEKEIVGLKKLDVIPPECKEAKLAELQEQLDEGLMELAEAIHRAEQWRNWDYIVVTIFFQFEHGEVVNV